MAKITTKQILDAINSHQYEQLDEYLSDVDWMAIEPATIIPQPAIRSFAKAIDDKEVRLDVMQFLVAYAENYFMAGAERLVREEFAKKREGVSSTIVRMDAEQRIKTFKNELSTQIKQIQSSGEFSGDKFSKQKKRIEQLEKQVEELVEKNANLETKLDKWEHPYDYGKYIPEPLRNDTFGYIMNFLKVKRIVREMYSTNEMGYRQICCYHWDGSKALFGYFVDRVTNALNLRGARVPMDWQVFKPAIHNFEDILEEARKALSTYNNSSSLQKNRIKDSEKIDDAIKNALEYVNEKKQPEHRPNIV